MKYASGVASQDAPEAITEWQIQREVRPGFFSLRSFDFEQPRLDLEVSAQANLFEVESSLEVYDYLPEGYQSVARGDDLALLRLEEAAASGTVIQARSRNRGLTVATTLRLEGHYDPAFDGHDFLITEQTIRIDQADSFQSSDPGEDVFESSFRCLPAEVPFRPRRLAPKPIVAGPQTATVVGPSGEEIHVDSLGRVKVQFHWDRLGNANEASSCAIRVAQTWAGKGFGTLQLPRIGQEVVIEFLEGDPDCPLVTGAVYNGVQKPPVDPAEQPTVTTWKSSSSKGGQGFNEIRFDDKKDSEQVFVHAQKDAHRRVLNDRIEWTGRDHHRIVKGKDHAKIEGDLYEEVVGDRREKLGANDSLKVVGDRMVHVEGGAHQKVDGDGVHDIGGDLSAKVGGDLPGKASGNIAFDGKNLHLKAGTNTVIEAATQLTLKVGGNFIVISSAGIDIQGSMLKLNSGGSAGSGAGCSPGSPSAPDAPEEPLEAATASAGGVSTAEAKPGKVAGRAGASTPATKKQAQVLSEAAESGAPFCEKCEEEKKKQQQQQEQPG